MNQVKYWYTIGTEEKETHASYPLFNKEYTAETIAVSIIREIDKKGGKETFGYSVEVYFNWGGDHVKASCLLGTSYDNVGTGLSTSPRRILLSEIDVVKTKLSEIIRPDKNMLMDYLLMKSIKYPEYQITFYDKKCELTNNNDTKMLWYIFETKGISLNHFK